MLRTKDFERFSGASGSLFSVVEGCLRYKESLDRDVLKYRRTLQEPRCCGSTSLCNRGEWHFVMISLTSSLLRSQGTREGRSVLIDFSGT